MKVSFQDIISGKLDLNELAGKVSLADIREMSLALFHSFEELLAEATDTTISFVPHDAAASDQSEQGWTINHIVAHLTATLEETLLLSSLLVRGIRPEERLRTEVPWEELSTTALVLARLRESQRLCGAYLDAWPDEPRLGETITRIPRLGPLNGTGVALLGIGHGQAHIEQVQETLRQYALAAHS